VQNQINIEPRVLDSTEKKEAHQPQKDSKDATYPKVSGEESKLESIKNTPNSQSR
jgi:hypothetical protein